MGEFGDTFSDFADEDFDEIEDSAWNIDSDIEDEPDNSNEAEDNEELLETFRISVDDRKDISRRIGHFTDAKNYFVCASTAENHIQVLWKKAEHEKY